jgi:hypothetical protein
VRLHWRVASQTFTHTTHTIYEIQIRATLEFSCLKDGLGLAKEVGEAPAAAQAEPACFVCNIDLIYDWMENKISP